jgi:hypothetical protein
VTALSTREALQKALAGHAPHVGPVSGSWTCPQPCNAMSTDGDIREGTVTSRDQRAAEWRAHLADALLASGVVVEADALADDEVLARRFLAEWVKPYFGPDGADPVAAVRRALAAALSGRAS